MSALLLCSRAPSDRASSLEVVYLEFLRWLISVPARPLFSAPAVGDDTVVCGLV